MNRKSMLAVITRLVLAVLIMAMVMGLMYWMFKEKKENLKESKIKSSMLLIQGAGKLLYEDCVMKKTMDKLIGTKISDFENNESIDKEVINKFKEKNIIEEGDYEKYYILTDADLESLEVYVRNEEKSYYIIGYEKDEIIITKGYEGKYKLSEINADNNEKEKKEGENKKETEEKKEEEKSEDDSESNEEGNSEEGSESNEDESEE